MPTTSAGVRYPSADAAPNVPQDIQNLANDVTNLVVLPTRVVRLERLGSGVDNYSNSDGVTNLLSGTWVNAPAGAYMLRPTLAVQATANTAGSIILVANGVTLTKTSVRADIPAATVAVHTYSYPFGHGGGNLTASMSHAPAAGGTVSVFNSTTQLVIEYLGRLT